MLKTKKGEITLITKGVKDQAVRCLLLRNKHLSLIQGFDTYVNLCTPERHGGKLICDICLCAFENGTTLAKHKFMCLIMIARLRFPSTVCNVKLINHAKAYDPFYFAIYDFKSILR